MLRQKREKSGTGICHVIQGKESKPVPMIFESTTHGKNQSQQSQISFHVKRFVIKFFLQKYGISTEICRANVSHIC